MAGNKTPLDRLEHKVQILEKRINSLEKVNANTPEIHGFDTRTGYAEICKECFDGEVERGTTLALCKHGEWVPAGIISRLEKKIQDSPESDEALKRLASEKLIPLDVEKIIIEMKETLAMNKYIEVMFKDILSQYGCSPLVPLDQIKLEELAKLIYINLTGDNSIYGITVTELKVRQIINYVFKGIGTKQVDIDLNEVVDKIDREYKNYARNETSNNVKAILTKYFIG